MRIHEVVASVIENQLWVVEPLVACCVLLWFCVGSGQHWTPQSWIDMVSISISSHFNIALHMDVYGTQLRGFRLGISIWFLELLAPGHLAHLAPGCHHKVFGAASNVVYSYAGPSLTGVNHRAGNMDLGMGWSLMSIGAPNLRSRSLVVLWADGWHAKVAAFGDCGAGGSSHLETASQLFLVFFVCFSGLHDGTFNTERWCRAHQHSPLEARRFPTSLPDQRSTSGWNASMKQHAAECSDHQWPSVTCASPRCASTCWWLAGVPASEHDVLPQRCANLQASTKNSLSVWNEKLSKKQERKTMKNILYHTVSTCKILQRSRVLSAQVTILQGTRSCPVLPKFLWVCLKMAAACIHSTLAFLCGKWWSTIRV